MRYPMVLAAALLLCACATTENYENILKGFVGKSEDQLVQAWGPPDTVYETGGKKYLTYVRSHTGYVPGTPPTYQTRIIGNRAYTTGYGGSAGYFYQLHCKTTFTLSGGTVTAWRHEGNDCRARAPE